MSWLMRNEYFRWKHPGWNRDLDGNVKENSLYYQQVERPHLSEQLWKIGQMSKLILNNGKSVYM